MRAVIIAIALMCLHAAAVSAQEAPQVSVDLPETETTVGQPLVVRIKVLVPTWMPGPPDFSSLEVPGLLVRLPERASGPVSESVNGETWSGVQRTYRVYPLQEGSFTIPSQPMRIQYAVPGATDARTVDVTLPEIAFDAALPEGASTMQPVIIARDFSLEAQVEGVAEMGIGDALVRTITARIDGTTPILIPQLTPAVTTVGLRSYPDEPKVSETEERGILSGERRERTTYLAQSEDNGALPALRIEWFNLEAGQLETAEIPAVPFTISPASALGWSREDLPWRVIVGALIALFLLAAMLRAILPSVQRHVTARRQRHLASEEHAHRGVLAAIHQQNLGDVFAALDHWKTYYGSLPEADLERALARLGEDRFSRSTPRSETQAWFTLRESYAGLRRDARRQVRRRQSGSDLPALNLDWEK